ncbi:MAG: zinc metalloprotease HtpX [Fimbriimonadaceae bacterium]
MNTLKVGFLLVALTALFVTIGHLVGGTGGMIIAFGLALAMNFGSYWFSDKLVLRMTGAQPVTPEQAPELYAMTERLAQRADIPMPRLYIVEDPSPNAFATGRNPQNGVVAVHTGLLDILNKPEVEGVIAHELAHIKHRDTLTMAIVASVAGGVMMLASFARFAAIFGGGNDEEGGNPLVLLLVSIFAPVAALLVQMGVSRSREFEADRMGAEIAGSGRGLASALLQLESGVDAIPGHTPPQAAHMCIINPLASMSGLMNLFRTHPATADRVKKLREWEKNRS